MSLAKMRAHALPAQAWKTISAVDGSQGPRLHQWARTAIRPLAGPGYGLLIRRSISDPTDRAFYLCYSPTAVSLTDLVTVAGARWAIEESFQSAKGEVGLDSYQIRRYDAWYRHITLAMLAHAFLTITRAATEKGCSSPQPGDLIPLTVPEVRRLLARLIWQPTADTSEVLAWSHWRRRHQAHARH